MHHEHDKRIQIAGARRERALQLADPRRLDLQGDAPSELTLYISSIAIGDEVYASSSSAFY